MISNILTLIKGKSPVATVTTVAPVATPAPFPTTPVVADAPKPPKMPFGGKAHTLTDEDRAKGAAARKAKSEARKAEKAASKAAEREARKAAAAAEREAARAKREAERDQERLAKFGSELAAAFNYLVKRPEGCTFFGLGDLDCNVSALAVKLAMELPGVRFNTDLKQGDWEVVLKHRKTGAVLILFAQGGKLFFASEYTSPADVPASLTSDLALIVTRAGVSISA